MSKTITTFLCDVAGCDQKWDIAVDGEKRCYHHAVERMHQSRREKGLPAIIVDEKGVPHVQN